MATPSFISELVAKHPNFVLKLRLVGVAGDPQIRRVRLHRIEDDGKVSYPALVEIAIDCTFPEDLGLTADDYEVGLTYYDVDNDCITIGCTEELMDAIDQFARVENPVLKITTQVKRKEGRVPVVASRAEKAAAKEDTPASPVDRPAQVPKLLESFVTVLSKALDSLQQHVNEVNQSGKPPSAAATATATATSTKETPKTTTDDDEEEEAVKEVVGNIGAKTESRPFIHGRHTCNGCLCTPIIGTRHHATNMVDYDLCTKCKDEYKGSEIEFEELELDRDRPMQERWHRKRARFAGQGACRPNGRGRRCGPGAGPRCGPGAGPRGPRGAARPFRGGRRGPRWQEGSDDALKEAIRRSLQDVKPPAPEPKVVPEIEIVSTTTTVASADEADEADETELPIEESTPVAIVEVTPEPPIEDSKPSPSAPVAVEETTETTEESAEAPKPSPSAPVAVEEPTETTEESAEASKPSPSAPVAVEEPTETTEESAEASFSSDAAGYGDAAENLGKTLDECAQVIDAMVTELGRSVSRVDDDATEDGQEIVVETVDEPSLEESATSSRKIDVMNEQTIVAGEDQDNDDDDKSSDASEDEWHVVEGEEEQVANDEMIARAAQLIGSSLFQSDLRSSETGTETYSTLSNSGHFAGDESVLSLPSSVPSVTSAISPAVLDRFAFQLSQLHELGFTDDAKNVDVLEHLNAARIGVDDDDEISVTHVVNALLN